MFPASCEEPTIEGDWEGQINIPGLALDIPVDLAPGDDGTRIGTIEEYGAIEETISPEVLDIITEWIRERFARSMEG